MGCFTSGYKTIIPPLRLCQDGEESSAAEKKRAHNSSSAGTWLTPASSPNGPVSEPASQRALGGKTILPKRNAAEMPKPLDQNQRFITEDEEVWSSEKAK